MPLTNDGCGDGWVLDLRAGELHGSVIKWFTEEGLLPNIKTYPSIQELIGDFGDYSE